jgi:hypothetical protein
MSQSKPIDPVRKSIEVTCDAKTAFAFYTEHLNDWWPRATHSLGQARTRAVAMECREGGRLYETQEDGTTSDWGRIIAWEPGRRLVHSWHVGRPETEATEIELRFTPLPNGGTRVDLEHRNWENFGPEAAALRDEYNPGWDHVFGACFGGYVKKALAA